MAEPPPAAPADLGDWTTLATGSADQRRAHAVLARHRPFDRLDGFDTGLAGTFPLDIAVPGSDLDILVHAPDPAGLAPLVDAAFGGQALYARRLIMAADGPALVAGFLLDGLPLEIFAQGQPVARQAGWRHMLVEARLLALAPGLRGEIRALKAAGMKTEPAFCHLLGLTGDPYAALASLENLDNTALYGILAHRRPAMHGEG
ncbi:DUF4269 domain-containing protein [Niveispirillum fermenti]|uniref:DUF4269 domain-containing protein n=1 Tax=Niveispirillum fermenti TaxID=1233113 RepID=UPI003A83CC5D